jgi:hypothetical protein
MSRLKLTNQKICEINPPDYEQIDLFLNRLSTITANIQKQKPEYSNLKLHSRIYNRYGDEYVEMHIYGDRDETDKEMQDRLAQMRSIQQQRESAERSEYLRLKEKFGKS